MAAARPGFLMYETFDHTADLGLRVRTTDLETLFAEAAAAVFTAIVPDLTTVQPQVCREVRLPADDREYLLFDWLKSLLFMFDTEHLLFGRFQVRLSDEGLVGSAWGEPLDRARHVLEHEVKAITYHALRVEATEDGWLAEIIVDI
jgi:SHS2 domain-containing protein